MSRSSEQQLKGFLAKFEPHVAKRAAAALKKLQAALPGAHRLVYDNFNALAIGFSPTEKAGDGIFSIAVYPRWVTLFFLQGKGLTDPKKRLKGEGARVRHVVLEDAGDLDSPDIRALRAQALKKAKVPLTAKRGGQLIIKSISAVQRPRRPTEKK